MDRMPPIITKPVRLQLSRISGFNLQALSLAANGLPAVSVARPSKWGNPFPVSKNLNVWESVDEFKKFVDTCLETRGFVMLDGKHWISLKMIREELGGKNLACWCKAEPCHATELLRIANK